MRITEAELAQARAAWGDALISIARTYGAEGIDAARTTAERVLNTAYGYDLGPVLFKPTLASGETTFRPTKKGALSYFTGHDVDYPLDAGFAIREWSEVRFETAAIFVDGDVAMWMGWAIMTERNGQVTKTEKSWGYKKDSDRMLRIVLHHSSLPYTP